MDLASAGLDAFDEGKTSREVADQSVKPKREKQIYNFRIIDYDREIAIKAKTLMSNRPYSNTEFGDGIAPSRFVIPAQAGIQVPAEPGWTPAFAGMTGDRVDRWT